MILPHSVHGRDIKKRSCSCKDTSLVNTERQNRAAKWNECLDKCISRDCIAAGCHFETTCSGMCVPNDFNSSSLTDCKVTIEKEIEKEDNEWNTCRSNCNTESCNQIGTCHFENIKICDSSMNIDMCLPKSSENT